MTEHVYRVIELAGSSDKSIEDAIQGAVSRAGSTLDELRWFEVTELRGALENNKVAHWQVKLKVGFTIKDGGAGQ